MNNLTINGRLIKDPTLRTFKNNLTLCTFYIANDFYSSFNKKTGFFKCKAWGNMGKTIARYANAGTELTVNGRLSQHIFEDQDGNTIFDTSITVEKFNFGSRLLEAAS